MSPLHSSDFSCCCYRQFYSRTAVACTPPAGQIHLRDWKLMDRVALGEGNQTNSPHALDEGDETTSYLLREHHARPSPSSTPQVTGSVSIAPITRRTTKGPANRRKTETEGMVRARSLTVGCEMKDAGTTSGSDGETKPRYRSFRLKVAGTPLVYISSERDACPLKRRSGPLLEMTRLVREWRRGVCCFHTSSLDRNPSI